MHDTFLVQKNILWRAGCEWDLDGTRYQAKSQALLKLLDLFDKESPTAS